MRTHHISYSSFCRWKRELGGIKALARVVVSPAFVELTPTAPVAVSRWDVELELGDGVFLRLRGV
ncbi:MAG: hypothetical protein HY943_10655 [Gammaproteobacteria bacterium]|nr:hypothetical protein [Gammaproteobacteria bacterium]